MLAGKKVGFIGGGNMAEAIIKGLLAGGVRSSDISVSEPVEARREYLSKTYGVSVGTDNSALVKSCQVIITAVKPQVCGEVLRGIAGVDQRDKLFISIMAGVRTETIESNLGGNARVVRVMPNTPALVLAAASAISPGSLATADDLSVARGIFDLLGTTCTVDEKLLDAVTGLSGSGPAYVFTFIEALSDAGVKNGLPRDVASRLAAQTVFGSAKMVLETGEHPAMLREKVTSPGGTTIAGLHVLEQEGLRGTIMTAVDAATTRSMELGKK
ncbi:MAG TPA: pyrroline-5-carboxylate reductase [Geobacteraceae bacterium]|nr:pyrroline-5-carboxylate reductase [Geobacteraceae bacterium]